MLKPACFTDAEWRFYVGDGVGITPQNHCRDCTPEYEARMKAQGRCDRGPVQSPITDAIRTKPMSLTEIVALTGKNPSQVKATLSRLVNSGRISIANGRYRCSKKNA